MRCDAMLCYEKVTTPKSPRDKEAGSSKGRKRAASTGGAAGGASSGKRGKTRMKKRGDAKYCDDSSDDEVRANDWDGAEEGDE